MWSGIVNRRDHDFRNTERRFANAAQYGVIVAVLSLSSPAWAEAQHQTPAVNQQQTAPANATPPNVTPPMVMSSNATAPNATPSGAPPEPTRPNAMLPNAMLPNAMLPNADAPQIGVIVQEAKRDDPAIRLSDSSKPIDFMPIVTAIVAFLLSGLLGNNLLQKWQRRTWYSQQHFTGKEGEYKALRSTVSAVAELSSARLASMKRLYSLLVAKAADSDIELELAEYRRLLREWNAKLNVFFVELTMYDCRGSSVYLDNCLQYEFYRAGQKLDAAIRGWRNGTGVVSSKELWGGFDTLNARLYQVNAYLLSRVERRSALLYFGKKVHFNKYTLEDFTTWELLKALFVRDINSFAVIRSTSDPGVPGRRRT